MKKRNEEKAAILYDFLDNSKLFKGTVRKEDRSLMNVPFVTGDKRTGCKICCRSKKRQAWNLKRTQNGWWLRASSTMLCQKRALLHWLSL